jgi:hypothetical protein
MHTHRVRALLMGGQACVLYGAAEFSRDTDLAVLADPANLARLDKAVRDLQAEVIAVPPFRIEYLQRGHAVHFRCHHAEAFRMRVDIMSRLRGVDPFPKLWARRTSMRLADGLRCEVLALPDLVRAKKTQRDKDWPMIRRLVEAHYFQARERPTAVQVRFWLRELRTPTLILEVVRRYPRLSRRAVLERPLLGYAARGRKDALERALTKEEAAERQRDRRYWLPLRKELEQLRHAR